MLPFIDAEERNVHIDIAAGHIPVVVCGGIRERRAGESLACVDGKKITVNAIVLFSVTQHRISTRRQQQAITALCALTYRR